MEERLASHNTMYVRKRSLIAPFLCRMDWPLWANSRRTPSGESTQNPHQNEWPKIELN